MDMSIPKCPPPPPGLPNIKQRKDAIILATRSHTSTSQKNNSEKQIMTNNARSFLRGHLIPLPEDEFEVEKLSPKVIPKTIAIIRRTDSTNSSHMQQSKKKKSVLCRFFLLKRNRMRRFHRTCLTTADDGESILSEESFDEKVRNSSKLATV